MLVRGLSSNSYSRNEPSKLSTFQIVVIVLAILLVLVCLGMLITTQKFDYIYWAFGIVLLLAVIAFPERSAVIIKLIKTIKGGETQVESKTPHNKKSEGETKRGSPNVKATIADKKTIILINLMILNTEEHNLNFGILFDTEMVLREKPEIKLNDERLTQKGITFSTPYIFEEYKRHKYLQIIINKPTSVPVGEALGIEISKNNQPELNVVSIIQLQPNGNHTEIPIQKSKS